MSVHDDIKKHPTACDPAVRWIKTLPADMTSAEAWGICPHGDFMAWICAKVGVPESERWIWPQLAMEWAAMALDAAKVKHELRDCATIVDKKTASVAACTATCAAYAADVAASDAANAASYAPHAARAASRYAARAADLATYVAADATYAAAYAAANAAYAVARAADDAAAVSSRQADMIRARIANPFLTRLKGKQES